MLQHEAILSPASFRIGSPEPGLLLMSFLHDDLFAWIWTDFRNRPIRTSPSGHGSYFAACRFRERLTPRRARAPRRTCLEGSCKAFCQWGAGVRPRASPPTSGSGLRMTNMKARLVPWSTSQKHKVFKRKAPRGGPRPFQKGFPWGAPHNAHRRLSQFLDPLPIGASHSTHHLAKLSFLLPSNFWLHLLKPFNVYLLIVDPMWFGSLIPQVPMDLCIYAIESRSGKPQKQRQSLKLRSAP